MIQQNLTLEEKLLLPNGPERLAEEGDHIEEVLDLVSGISFERKNSEKEMTEGSAPCGRETVLVAGLAYLIRVAKQKQAREWIEKRISDGQLGGWLQASSPKIRKNGARLIGQLNRESLDKGLCEALAEEQTRMVRPSMILALGALGTKPALKALRSYVPAEPQDISEEKHCMEEREALRKALASLVKETPHRFTDYPGRKGFVMELRCGRGFEEALKEELRQKQTGQVLRVHSGSVLVEGLTHQKLMTVRGYREALIPLPSVGGQLTDSELASMAKETVNLLKQTHEGNPPFRFRLETGKREGTAALAARLEKAAKGELNNTPGNYECEIRLRMPQKTGERVRVWVKLYTQGDDRFAYRKAAVAASIHPANAAGIMGLAAPWLKKGAVVMDPCCGSGTLLAERAMVSGKTPAGLLGVDLAKAAMEAAEKNLAGFSKPQGPCRVHLLNKDLRTVAVSAPVDELFANLPFGNRVGSHADNEDLYRVLMEKLPQWVKPGGIAVLYTMEGTLLMNEAKRISGLTLLKAQRVEAGGLEPLTAIFRVGEKK